jgi:exopolyphosphatase / guanosine-5'-triphosphate,3'-diphosphate pyrophosphatase
MAGRYEFRIWAESLGGLKSRIEGMGGAGRAESSEDLYLIAAATDTCNAKIRGALIDIKILSGTDGRLEQWQLVLKSRFPIEAALIKEQIFPRLELEAPELSKDRYIMDEFLEVVSARPGISIVPVAKKRMRFDLRACLAEFSKVTIKNVPRETVAVESDDPGAVLRAIRDLGIDSARNTSYIREIKRVLGRVGPLAVRGENRPAEQVRSR